MNHKIAGGPCKFYSRQTVPTTHCIRFAKNQRQQNLFPLTSRRCSCSMLEHRKNCHFLWGCTFCVLTECCALMWLMDYKGHNRTIINMIKLAMMDDTRTKHQIIGPFLRPRCHQLCHHRRYQQPIPP